MSKSYQICTRCIMDTTDSGITFNENGVCNRCRDYEKKAKEGVYYNKAGRGKLDRMVEEIKKEGRDKKYDCLIGLSGGIDSTMVAFLAKKMGLRFLAIHLDNNWDTELSIQNIKRIIDRLNFDFLSFKTNWEEFKDLQLSFLKASVPNCEIPTDHAITAILSQVANKENIRFVLTGANVVTEGIMPESWGYDSKDLKYLKVIHKKFGNIKLKTFPQMDSLSWVLDTFIKKIKYIPILNYIPYRKEEAKKFLKKELEWQDYGMKHYESIYTRFFQGYILPRKFNIDKRLAHFSTLICSGQMTRAEALEKMKENPYPSQELLEKDKEYVLKKLELTNSEFERIMDLPIKNYRNYPNNSFLFSKLNFFIKFAKRKATYNY